MMLKDLCKAFDCLPYDLIGKQKPLEIEIKGFKLESAKSAQLLGITIDYNLAFDTHVSNICKTARAKIKSLSRIRKETGGITV